MEATEYREYLRDRAVAAVEAYNAEVKRSARNGEQSSIAAAAQLMRGPELEQKGVASRSTVIPTIKANAPTVDDCISNGHTVRLIEDCAAHPEDWNSSNIENRHIYVEPYNTAWWCATEEQWVRAGESSWDWY